MSVAAKSSNQLFIAGAVGGVAECIAVQPFDMVKTRFQLNEKKNTSVVIAIRSLLQEGGFFRLYRGILPELAGMIPKSSLMYGSQELFKREITRKNGGKATTLVAFGSGFLSGYPETISVTPFQVVKVRLQAKEHLGRYKNSFDCLFKVLREEGLKAFTIGFGPTCWRNCVWNSVYFGFMHWLKGVLPTPPSKVLDVAQTLLSGAIGGILATGFNAPFDVVKSRFQSQLPSTLTGKPVKYRYTIQSLITIYREEGARALYKGFAPKSIRMAVGGGVCMAAFELTCYFLPEPAPVLQLAVK